MFWSIARRFLLERHLKVKSIRSSTAIIKSKKQLFSINCLINKSNVINRTQIEESHDALHLLHLFVEPGPKSGFQSSVSVSNLSANHRQKLLNFPLLTKDTLEQHVSSICSTRNTIAGPGSCSENTQKEYNYVTVSK